MKQELYLNKLMDLLIKRYKNVNTLEEYAKETIYADKTIKKYCENKNNKIKDYNTVIKYYNILKEV